MVTIEPWTYFGESEKVLAMSIHFQLGFAKGTQFPATLCCLRGYERLIDCSRQTMNKFEN